MNPIHDDLSRALKDRSWLGDNTFTTKDMYIARYLISWQFPYVADFASFREKGSPVAFTFTDSEALQEVLAALVDPEQTVATNGVIERSAAEARLLFEADREYKSVLANLNRNL